MDSEKVKQLPTLPGLLEDPCVVGLLHVKEQQVPIATTVVHHWQYRTSQDSLVPICDLIHQLDSRGVISKTQPPSHSLLSHGRLSNAPGADCTKEAQSYHLPWTDPDCAGRG